MLKISLKNLIVPLPFAMLVVVVVLTGGCAGTPVQEAPSRIIEDVTPQAAFALVQDNENNPDFVIVDVRTSEEVAEGYIKDAININFYSKTFRDDIDRLDKGKTYLIYCRSGNRSGRALKIMDELNFRGVYNMTGGIIQWKSEGLPLTK